jgi:hypothetical protein
LLKNLDIGNISATLYAFLPGRVQKIIVFICAQTGDLDALILQTALEKCLTARLFQVDVMSAFHAVSSPGSMERPHRVEIKSGFLAPAYTNLAVGIDVKPLKWLSLNIAPLTGGFVIVTDPLLRKNYGMQLKDEWMDKTEGLPEDGSQYKSARFEFGAQIKADIAVKVNDNFSYTSQLVLFSNYLDKPENLRVNWDNRFDWKLAKYFSLTLTTNLIYDDKVMIFNESDGLTKQRVQFKESLLFGFTYTIASKK